MSRRIEYEGQVGLVKFGTWAYKFKNEHVRAYIEHIGSLQGLFVDPSDWVAKWEKIYSFYEESHDNLVPLTLANFCQEIDMPRIRRYLGGGFLGFFCGVCCACYPCCSSSKKWHQCRMGLIMGNMACFFIGAIIMFSAGFVLGCRNYDDSSEDLCDTTQNILFIFGAILAIFGFAMGVFVYILSQKKIRDKLPPQLAAIVASKEQREVSVNAV